MEPWLYVQSCYIRHAQHFSSARYCTSTISSRFARSTLEFSTTSFAFAVVQICGVRRTRTQFDGRPRSIVILIDVKKRFKIFFNSRHTSFTFLNVFKKILQRFLFQKKCQKMAYTCYKKQINMTFSFYAVLNSVQLTICDNTSCNLLVSCNYNSMCVQVLQYHGTRIISIS